MSDITTWADGYGVWHARVPNRPDAHKAAKRAVLRELRQREKLTPAYSVRSGASKRIRTATPDLR